jgi:cytochrome c-type biogenesis protein
LIIHASAMINAVGEDFQRTAADGALLAAIVVSVLAGLVSFFSPCVLPLVPAYLSYVTGMSGVELEARDGQQRGRVVLGVGLFVLGFAVFFTSLGAFFGNIGYELRYATWVEPVAGVLVILFGLAFLGVVPGLDRTWRIRAVPRIGLAGAPLLGLVFAIGWLPCIGPTLSAVLTLSVDSATAGRGALLTLAYGLGLGVPFLVVAVAYQRALGGFGWVREHGYLVTRVGGIMLVLLGVLLITGAWGWFTGQMLGWISGVSTVI